MTKPSLLLVGANETRVWGMTAEERARRIARDKFDVVETLPAAGPVLLVDVGHAFDPLWLGYIATRPDTVLTLGGRPVLGNTRDASAAASVVGAMQDGVALPEALTVVPIESGVDVHNEELRKREQPFLLPLRPDTVPAIERASYYGAYKGVTDILTKYLWPELALHLTRLSARLGLTPNFITLIGFLFCVAAFWAFWNADYWLGMGLGFVFMVLDTVDGKLARCTITSSSIGNVLDHGVDLVHPPFWWWAWMHGLAAYGTPIPRSQYELLLIVIAGGYVLGRAIEGAFMRVWGMHIHVWRPVDSWFRLITARRNPNMVILFASMLVARPDLGIWGIAIWTVASILFHLVRLLQAAVVSATGRPIVSWLS